MPKTTHGKPIITPEERAYFDGLNDNLKAFSTRLVQKEMITRPEHLATLLVACNCVRKKWNCSCKTIACCATAILQIPIGGDTLFSCDRFAPSRRRT